MSRGELVKAIEAEFAAAEDDPLEGISGQMRLALHELVVNGMSLSTAAKRAGYSSDEYLRNALYSPKGKRGRAAVRAAYRENVRDAVFAHLANLAFNAKEEMAQISAAKYVLQICGDSPQAAANVQVNTQINVNGKSTEEIKSRIVTLLGINEEMPSEGIDSNDNTLE